MRKQLSVLQKITGDRQITMEQDPMFLFHLQNSLLLSLLERGSLSRTQYHLAEEKLRQQFPDHVSRGGASL